MTAVRLVAEAEGWPVIVPEPGGGDTKPRESVVPGRGRVLEVAVADLAPVVLLHGGERAGRAWRHLPRVAVDARGLPAEPAALFVEGVQLGAWQWDLRTRPTEPGGRHPEARLGEIGVLCDDSGFTAKWRRREAGAAGCCYTRGLVTEPSNRLSPASFPARMAELRQAGVAVEVLDAAALRRDGMGGLLAVGAASVHAPCLIVLRWDGVGRPIAFVGKGITFDTGGVCVKPAEGMWEMRADMAGAAACAGAMLAVAQRGEKKSAMAVLAVAENALGGGGWRPGDVVRCHSGRNVEVVDTDAEGRMALADALSWTAAQSPRAMVDVATLTGAAVVALGAHRAALFGNDEALTAAVAEAGEAVGERVWRLPIARTHREALESDIADLRHCVPGRGQPDACQAAAFLREFVGDTPWAHLDIAGTDSRGEGAEEPGGATGFGARLLDRLAEVV